MRCYDNKTELFQMISGSLSKINCSTQIVISKNLLHVESNCNIDTKNLQPCNHDNADSRMVVHLKLTLSKASIFLCSNWL